MQIQATKKEVKTVVSALRRELKSLDKPITQLTHNECLTLLAKAFGHASWNAWEAALPANQQDTAAEPVAPAYSYPLQNFGAFDFVPAGIHGKPVSGRFVALAGTHELVPGTARVQTVSRIEGGVDIDYAGYTDMHWNSQETVTNGDKSEIWVAENDSEHSSKAIVLLPADFDGDPQTSSALPVRAALVEAYLQYFREAGQLEVVRQAGSESDKVLDQAEALLGFALTEQEEAAIRAYSR